MRANASSRGEHIMTRNEDLPVAVIGAGPVGLAAAAHLIARRIPVRLYEAGDSVASHLRDWGHVRLFSPWRFNIDEMAKSILFDHGWREPPAGVLPTGRELYDAYLRPLAETPEIAAVTETGARVDSISRLGIDKVVSRDRAKHPFTLTVTTAAGSRIDLARAVIDASGTWRYPNPLGASGLRATGETELSSEIRYGIPDVLGRDRDAYAGRRVLVIGGGHSAANVVLDLAQLAAPESATQIVWALRSQSLARIFAGGDADRLPARGKLGSDLKRFVEAGGLSIVTGFSAERIERTVEGTVVTGRTQAGLRLLDPVDRVIVSTGQRPNLDMTRELRLDLDPWLESPRLLAPMIDPNVHSCGTVPPHGSRELAHAEPDFFTVGIKSYGRAPTFLMATGYEQARSVTAYLAGDQAAADNVRLVLPETGVCSSNLPEKTDAGCCGGAAPQEVDACCLADAEAKAKAKSGCGCTTAPLSLAVITATPSG
jgi:thioredoxin reductase